VLINNALKKSLIKTDVIAILKYYPAFPRVNFNPANVNYPLVAMSFIWMALNRSSIDPGGATVVPRYRPTTFHHVGKLVHC